MKRFIIGRFRVALALLAAALLSAGSCVEKVELSCDKDGCTLSGHLHRK